MKISVIINTFNEERNIKNCLESVKWADEIIIVDMYSDDKTVEIAKKYTDNIFFFERMGYADPARQFALEKASNEWILIVDADELVPLKSRDKLFYILKNDLADIVYIPRSNYFIGQQINEMGWGALQDIHPRFFKKDHIRFGDEIHDFYRIDENSRKYIIDNPQEGLIHFSYIDYEHYIEKALNRYTSIEAENIFEGKKEKIDLGNSSFAILFKLFREFTDYYIINKGYKDGFRGFSISFLAIMYSLMVYMKLKLMEEYNSKDTRELIMKEYQNTADKIISEYNGEI
jgi:glycosyltransferase involved in cell wall biosynthesis